MKKNDAQLVEEVLKGDMASFAVLVRKYQGLVYGLAYDIVKNFADAEDLAQETFLQAYLKLPQLREPSRFAGWLRRITCSICNMWVRSQHEADLPMDAVEGDGAAIQTERTELDDAVLKAVNSLSEKNRLVITLFYIDGLSYKEISDFLEVPLTTIGSRLHKARKQLKGRMIEMLEKDFAKKNLGPEFAAKVVEGALEIIPYAGYEPGYGIMHLGGAREDDVYISPSQIKKLNLKTGDIVSGEARPPRKDKGEHYHAMIYVHTVNQKDPRM